MKVQVLIAALVTIASSTPTTEAPLRRGDSVTIDLLTRAINDVLAGIKKSTAGVFTDHRARFPSPYGYSIQGDVFFNGSKLEGIEDIQILKDIESKYEETYLLIGGAIHVPHYLVTGSVTFNATRYDDGHRGSASKRIVWGVESIADMDSMVFFTLNYFEKFNRISHIKLEYMSGLKVPKMQTTLKYSADLGWRGLGRELEPYVKRYFDQAPEVLLSWLSAQFQNLKLE